MAASAGSRHPVEVYLQAHGISGLADGLWHYGPAAHELVRTGPSVADGVAIVLTGVPWRTQWRYAERGYRHLWWDAGSIAAHLGLLARTAGRRARIRLDFPDAEIASAVGADGRAELVLAIVELTSQVSWRPPEQPVTTGDLGSDPWYFPLVGKTHRAASMRVWPPPTGQDAEPRDEDQADKPQRDTAVPAQVPPIGADELIRRRLTTRTFAPRALEADALTWPLGLTVKLPDWDAADIAPVARVFVHAVTGLEPGCYDFSSVASPLSAGDLRADAQAVCLGQSAARDCGYLVLLAADLDATLARRGERGYRDLQFYAGLAVSRGQLAATALGLGSCPLTICDEVAARFTPPGAIPLIALAVGHPARPGNGDRHD
jgi:SagB-type dehydrogenase family enzyme